MRKAQHRVAARATWNAAATTCGRRQRGPRGRLVLGPREVAQVRGVEAARFQIKGVQQDPGLFHALVAMLDDKNEEIRTIAAERSRRAQAAGASMVMPTRPRVMVTRTGRSYPGE